MFTIKKQARIEIIEKKSKFIASVYPVKDKQEAEIIIGNIKKEFWDATHNVYSYILPNNICKYSDDGEPQGTAGLPVYNILLKKELINVLVIVTRYFGGILLGKGGLVRAYSEAAKIGLEEAEIYEIIKFRTIEIICDYNIKDKLLFFLEKGKYSYNANYYEKVKFEIKLPEVEMSKFVQDVIKLTENKIFYKIMSK